MFAKSKLVIFGCILLIFLSGCDSTNTGLIVENPIFLCEGTPVENSTLCSGDNVGLIHNTPVTLAVSCTDAVKCEYVCDTGYKSIQNICIKSYVGPDTNVSVRTFSCTGVIPNNSNLCDNDDYNLTLDTPAVLATSCTPEKKCEYVCKEGYTNKDGNCVIVDTNFSCTGLPISNAVLCDGDGSGLTSAASNSIVSFCSSGNKCEYVCNSGYTKQGNACVGSSAQNYSCVGTAPQNATLCSGDETGLAWDSLRTLVISCSPDVKCEYTCSVGYEKQSTSCVAVAAPPAADTCTVVSTVNLMGLKVAVASPTDINASVSPQAEKSAVFVIFDNNVFVENAVNPYASVSGDVTGDVATWLKGKGIQKVVVSSATAPFSSSMSANSIECLKSSGLIRVVIGWGMLTGKDPNSPY